MGPGREKHITFCRICEATCGLEVETEDNRVVSIRPDPEHVVSQGFACVKGTRYASTQHSPDRLTSPIARAGDAWKDIGWSEALRGIAARAKAVVAEHGPESFGHFVGSAGGANVLAPIFRGALYKGIGSHRMYGTGTCDTMNKFRVNEEMYGSPMRLAYPDVEKTSFMMVLGANPAVSGNTLYHLPRARERFAAITKRGGRVVFVNPRRVESAASGEHLFIRPDTDLFFLAAFANELIRIGGLDLARIDAHMRGYDDLARVVADWTPERQAAVTHVPASVLRDLAAAHAATRAVEHATHPEAGPAADHTADHATSPDAGQATGQGAALYMATGVNQGRSGTLCFWLLEAINAASGNLDRPGGTLMGRGLVDMAKRVTEDPQMMTSLHREDDLPTVSGQQPAGMLADDILEGRVKALIVEASNPLLACSNPDGRLEEALSKLDLLVSIDLFRNETGDLAHYVLPAPTWLERPEIPYALQSFAGCCPTPYMIYADAVLEPPSDVRHEWWIYTRLAEEMGVQVFGGALASGAAKLAARLAYSPFARFLPGTEKIFDGMLKQGGLPGTREMSDEHPHGLLLSENEGENFLGTDRVLTPDGRVDLAPTAIVETFTQRAEALYRDELGNSERLKLIGLRQTRRLNTSSANCPDLVRDTTNHAYMSPSDADRFGLADGEIAEITSKHGKIEIPIRRTDEMMPGTVAIPQCWGHAGARGLSHAARHPGVNSNLLAGDGRENIERLSGMSHLSGILIDVRPLGAPS